jgi:hypothetical protein
MLVGLRFQLQGSVNCHLTWDRRSFEEQHTVTPAMCGARSNVRL